MPLNGSGTYNPPNPPVFPAVPGTTIKASDFNAIMNDMAAAISAMIARDGQSTITGVLQWAQPGLNLAALGGVALTGAQTIAGVKTFSSAPVSSAAAAAANELMRKGEVDSAVGAVSSGLAGKASLAGSAAQTFDVAPATTANQAVNLGQSFGLGQSWQNVTGSRAFNTDYTNSTSKTIVVAFYATSGSSGSVSLLINGVNLGAVSYGESSGSVATAQIPIPPGVTYQLLRSGSLTLTNWIEYR